MTAHGTSARGVIGDAARRTGKGRLVLAGLLVLLLVMAALSLFPFYWLLASSAKTPLEIVQFPPSWWPADFSLTSYSQAWSSLDFALYFGNSVIISVGVLLLRLSICLLAAYSLSRLRPPLAGVLMFLITVIIMVPPITYFVPQYVNITDVPFLGISLVNTWWAIWLPGITAPVVILLFKQFFDQLPGELFEAASIDGAGSVRTLFRVVMPLSRPVIAVTAIYTFIGVWQDFLWPLLTLPDDQLWPLEVALFRLRGGSVPLNIQMAGMVIATIPMVAVFLIFQRQIVRGIVLSEGK